jgi:hypothetical protein
VQPLNGTKAQSSDPPKRNRSAGFMKMLPGNG